MDHASGPRRNIELKARCDDLGRAAAAAERLGAARIGLLRQLDTYFSVPHGRLKLRETDDRAELIAYQRSDQASTRDSRYFVIPVPMPQEMKAALAATLGVRGEVRKSRELWMWHNVRIHLDTVERLGRFIEFEAVITDPSQEADLLDHLAQLTEALAIRDADRIAGSYSDLAGI